jgi:SynChlorMet cassette protein ScmD
MNNASDLQVCLLHKSLKLQVKLFEMGISPSGGAPDSVKTFSKSGKDTTVEARNPVANPLIVLREEFDDWAILFDPDTGNAFGLNPTGVFIWKHLDGKNGPDDIVRKLSDEAEDVPDDAGEHVRQFIASLEQQGLVGYEVEQGISG